MQLPHQSPPVARRVSRAAVLEKGIASSNIACDACHAACGALPWPASIACTLACDHTVCKL